MKSENARNILPVSSKGTKPQVLIVDDEPDTVDLIAFNLRQVGYDVTCAGDGTEALKKARSNYPDLIILDLMLPELNGFEVCKRLRADPNTSKIPVLMLTAKSGAEDRILGLELGANDYITKPFSPRELLLRIRNLMTQSKEEGVRSDVFHFEELYIDIPRHLVTVNWRPVELTVTEFRLLCALAERRGRVQSRELLLQEVWRYETKMDTRTVDTHMRRLREKLGKASRFLDTVRGVGYRFSDSF